jgi:penicillin-binding protein 1A
MFGGRLKKIFFYSSNILLSVAALILAVFYMYGVDLPDATVLYEYTPPTTTKIYSSENQLIEEYAIERRVVVPFSAMPLIIKGAFIIAEDRTFYEHSGISIPSLIRAIMENTVKKSWSKKPAGGSTITQQIAKNLLVGNAKNVSRKIREAIMAFRIEAMLSKDRILQIYLNQLYLGKGCYGIAEACDYYFAKSIEQILPHEAAFLAAIPSAPSVYINAENSPKLLLKRNSILHQMYDFGYISMEQLKDAVSQPIHIKLRKHKLSAPYFSDEIFRLFLRHIPKDSFFKGGYSVKTTMSKKIQHCATKALEDGLIEFTKTAQWRGPFDKNKSTMQLQAIRKQLPTTINKILPCIVEAVKKEYLICKTEEEKQIVITLSDTFYKNAKFKVNDVILCRLLENSNTYELYQPPTVTGGIIVMNPKTGDILGLSGGFSFDVSSFNCMTQAKRQPGSAIKPFVYAAAIEGGKDEFDIIEDKPIVITFKNGTKYVPHNYNNKCYGKTYLRDGLIYSRNLTTINLVLEIGMQPVAKMLQSAGLTGRKMPISAVLGSVETTPLNIMAAFSAFINSGLMVTPRFASDITNAFDPAACDILKDALCKVRSKRIMSENTAEIIKNMLHDTVKYGTAKNLAKLEEQYDVKILGKTGTTNDFKDAWFIGSITDNTQTYIVCVFVGHSTPRSLGKHCYGARVALPIFANFIKNMYLK